MTMQATHPSLREAPPSVQPSQRVATDWHEALDDYGRALVDFENRYAELGHAAGSIGYWLPSNLGPFPLELADVAGRLLERSAELEAQVQADLDAVGNERAAITRARNSWPKARPAAHFFDVRG